MWECACVPHWWKDLAIKVNWCCLKGAPGGPVLLDVFTDDLEEAGEVGLYLMAGVNECQTPDTDEPTQDSGT